MFVPCAGPVLAAWPRSPPTGNVGLRTILITVAYSLGAALPMLAILLGSQRLANGMTLLRREAPRIRVAAGVVLAADRVRDREELRPALHDGAARLHAGAAEARRGDLHREAAAARPARHRRGAGREQGADGAPSSSASPTGSTRRGGKALTLQGLRGKVVLVDFWTYSCINCLRTLPHLKAWDRALPQGRARDRRRPHARVRVRARAVERARAPSRSSASATRSPSTTSTGPGRRTTTSTGRPST